MVTVFLRVLRFLENLFCDISWWFEDLADGLDSELHDELRAALADGEQRVLQDDTVDGTESTLSDSCLFCVECKAICKKSGRGICCDCSAPAINWSGSEETHPRCWVRISPGSRQLGSLIGHELGFYCGDCQQACYIGLAPGQAEGLRCGCTWVPHGGGTKIEHWIPVTITITKRSSK